MTTAKFAPAIITYGGSSFSNDVGTCYCLQIRHLIVNGVFKWTILQVLNFQTDNNNSGTSHLMSMLFNTIIITAWFYRLGNLILLVLLMMQPFNFLRLCSFKLCRVFLITKTKCFVIGENDFKMFCLIVFNCQESRYSVNTSMPEMWHWNG